MAQRWSSDCKRNRQRTQEKSRWTSGKETWQQSQGFWEGCHSVQGDDKFRNCTTLGTKHFSLLDDRKDILLGMLAHLQTSVSGHVVFPRAAVGSWSANIVQAAIFVLCRAPASTSV